MAAPSAFETGAGGFEMPPKAGKGEMTVNSSTLNGEQDRVTFADGSTYVGEWRNGMMHGQGTSTFPNGSR